MGMKPTIIVAFIALTLLQPVAILGIAPVGLAPAEERTIRAEERSLFLGGAGALTCQKWLDVHRHVQEKRHPKVTRRSQCYISAWKIGFWVSSTE
jgi:hypothetical protein